MGRVVWSRVRQIGATSRQKPSFILFVVSEVHPYSDGNARVARALANATLVATGSTRLIVVKGYRDDYLRALKAFSHQANPGPSIHLLDRAHQFVAELPFDRYDRTLELLGKTRALDDTGDRRLRFPSELREEVSPVAPPPSRPSATVLRFVWMIRSGCGNLGSGAHSGDADRRSLSMMSRFATGSTGTTGGSKESWKRSRGATSFSPTPTTSSTRIIASAPGSRRTRRGFPWRKRSGWQRGGRPYCTIASGEALRTAPAGSGPTPRLYPRLPLEAPDTARVLRGELRRGDGHTARAVRALSRAARYARAEGRAIARVSPTDR